MKMSRAASVLLLAVALTVLLAPTCITAADGGSNASINLPGDQTKIQGPVELSVESNGTASTTYFIINNSNSVVFLNMVNTSIQDGNVTIKTKMTNIDGVETSTIMASISSNTDMGEYNAQNIGILTITVSADRYADTEDITTSVLVSGQYVGGDQDDQILALEFQMNLHIESTFYSEDAYNKFFGLVPNTLDAPLNNPWITAAVTMVIWIVATVIVCMVVVPLFTRLVGNRKDNAEKKSIRKITTECVSLLMFIVAVNDCAAILGAGAGIISLIGSVSSVFYVVIGAVLSWKVYLFIVSAILNGLDDSLDVDGIDNTLLPLFKLIGKLIIAVAAVTMILAAFGVDLAGIMVSAGVVTLGITFGAQEVLNQFFSGIVLLSTRPFKKGDFVKLNGDTYVVHKVRLMFTEFENWDRDQIVTMPNNAVTSATMINFTRGNKLTRIFIYVNVAYNADLSKAKELMMQAAKMHPHTVTDHSAPIPPGVRLTNFADSGIEYRLAVYVDDFDNSAHYAGQIREIIYKLFKDNKIEIPYNRVDVSFRSPLDATVRRPGDDEPDA